MENQFRKSFATHRQVDCTRRSTIAATMGPPAGVTTLVLGDMHPLVHQLQGCVTATISVGQSVELATIQLDHRFQCAVINLQDANGDEARHRGLIHCALQHLEPNGFLVVVHAVTDRALCEGFTVGDLELIDNCRRDGTAISTFQRGERTTVHDLVFEARSSIRRVTAEQLFERMSSVAPPLIVDTRSHTDRCRFGVIPGAIHVPRTVVEWHLDPSNGYLHPAVRGFDQSIVLVCNGGYSSSLATANLMRIGFTNAADLIGGHTAWCAAGLPVEKADHSHLDTPALTPSLTPAK